MNIIFSVIYIIVTAFFIDSIVCMVLPQPKIFVPNDNAENQIEYKKFNYLQAFKSSKLKPAKKKKQIVKVDKFPLMKNVVLKAIFKISQTDGYVLMTQKGKEDSIVLGALESYKGYKLSQLYTNYVVFTKQNKNYKLVLEDTKLPSIVTMIDNPNKHIVEDNGVKKLDRVLVDSYIQDPSKIWSNIAINEYEKDGKVIGFKIYRVQSGSVFDKLGLKAGDIMLKVNNIKLNSARSAFKIYNKIKKIKNLNIEVLRGNQKMELEYEIR